MKLMLCSILAPTSHPFACNCNVFGGCPGSPGWGGLECANCGSWGKIMPASGALPGLTRPVKFHWAPIWVPRLVSWDLAKPSVSPGTLTALPWPSKRSQSVPIYIYIYAYTCRLDIICIFTCIHVYIFTCIHLHIYMYIYIYTYIHIYIYIRMYKCIHICIHTSIHVYYIYVYMYLYIYIGIHILDIHIFRYT